MTAAIAQLSVKATEVGAYVSGEATEAGSERIPGAMKKAQSQDLRLKD